METLTLRLHPSLSSPLYLAPTTILYKILIKHKIKHRKCVPILIFELKFCSGRTINRTRTHKPESEWTFMPNLILIDTQKCFGGFYDQPKVTQHF